MRRARILGQYFTPEPVVELCCRMLQVLDPDARNPSVMDPACGDGAFLRYALAHGITARVYGIEKDPRLAASWEDQGLSEKADLTIGDGLLPFNAQSEIRNPKSFDWVVGNPPFGTRCLGEEADLEALARDYTIWRESRIRPRMPATYPIEILFLERFVQLAKPGGYVAIIVPDGILANARLSYVREWLAAHAEIKVVVSLPQHVFSRSGASSKSSVLVFRSVPHQPSTIDHQPSPVLMAAIDGGSWTAFAVESIQPGERLDPAYHHPEYVENVRFLETLPNVVRLGELIEYTTYGQVGRRELSDSGVRLITPANFVMTEDGYVSGLDIRDPERFVAPGSRNDPPRSRLRKGDLLLVNSGVGCIGRVAVFHGDEPCNISQHVNLIRLRGIEPDYLAVYLQTKYARLQIAREKCGVGACGINFDRIKSILVPVLPEEVRQEIARIHLGLGSSDGHALMGSLFRRVEQLIQKKKAHPPWRTGLW